MTKETKKQIIAQFNFAHGTHEFEVSETPKGLLQVRFDGETLTQAEMREMEVWLKFVTERKSHG